MDGASSTRVTVRSTNVVKEDDDGCPVSIRVVNVNFFFD